MAARDGVYTMGPLGGAILDVPGLWPAYAIVTVSGGIATQTGTASVPAPPAPETLTPETVTTHDLPGYVIGVPGLIPPNDTATVDVSANDDNGQMIAE